MALGTYLAVFAVMFLASTLQSAAGLGQGLLSAPLLRLLEPDLLPGPIVIAGMLTSIVLAMRNSRLADVAEVVPALAGRLVGGGFALALLAALSDRGLTIAIAVIVIGLVVLRLAGVGIPRTRTSLGATGVVSGVSGTIAALGGAPMALLFEQHTRARDFRGPMGAFAAIGGAISVGLLAVGGQIDGRALELSLWLLPPLFLGWSVERWVRPVIDRGLLRPIVLAVSGGSALVLLMSEIVR